MSSLLIYSPLTDNKTLLKSFLTLNSPNNLVLEFVIFHNGQVNDA